MSSFAKIIDFLNAELLNQLPGESAHHKMAPYKRANAKEALTGKKKPKLASTLLLLHEKQEEIYFTLIQRPNYNGTHGGQISFPGGKLEKNESTKEAALRETNEEIGISASTINILGQLTPVYIPPSNFLMTPYIGYIKYTPLYTPQEREVKEVIDIPIADLMNEGLVKTKQIPIHKYAMEQQFINAPYYELKQKTVWGATALVLSEFKEILKKLT